MLTLLNIFESEYKQIIIPKSPEEFKEYLDSLGQNVYDFITTNIFTKEQINKLFEYSKTLDDKKKYPFVCNYKNSEGFVVRRYATRVFGKDNDFFNKILSPKSNYKIGKKTKRIFQGVHDTSYNDDGTQSIRSYNGLKKEDDDLSDLLVFVTKLTNYFIEQNNKVTIKDINKLSDEILTNLFDNEIGNYERFYGMYHVGVFSQLIYSMINDESILPDKYIIKTGGEDIKRNKKGSIFTKDCNFGLSIINYDEYVDTLKNSGKIISDITIKNSLLNSNLEDVYISCKMKDSQLSAISVDSVMKTNKMFVNAISQEDDEKQIYFDDIKDNKDFKPFINFWNLFNIDAKEIFEIYKKNKNFMINNSENESGKFIINVNNNNNNSKVLLGRLIKMLIGANYWMLKGVNTAKFLSSDSNDLLFDITKAYITRSGKTINIFGELSNINISDDIPNDSKSVANIEEPKSKKINCKFVFRTSGGNTRFPYRITLDIDLDELSNIINLYSVKVEN